MKLKATIRESIEPTDTSVIVEFYGDAKKQNFEVHCTFNPYQMGVRKWDYWEFKIRFQTEIFEDSKTKKKSYFIHLFCDEAKPIHQIGENIERDWKKDRNEKDLTN